MSAVAGKSGRASVDIVADVSKFAGQLTRDLNAAARTVRVDLDPVSRQITANLQDGVVKGERALDTIPESAQRNMSKVADAAAQAGSSLDADIATGAESAGHALDGVAARAEEKMRETEEHSRKAGEGLGESFNTGGAKAEKALRDVDTRSSLLQGTLSRIGKIVSTGLFLKATAISVGLLAAVPAATNLLAALVPTTGILAALPAVALGGAAAVGTLKLGLLGVSDAITTSFGPNAKKAAADLAKLAPTAREFVKAIDTVQPAFKRLQLDVQQRLFAGWGAQVKSVSTTVLPLLHAQLPAVAGGFNLLGKELGAAVRQGLLLGALHTVLAVLPVVIAGLGAAIRPVLDGFAALAGTGASVLPHLAEGIVFVATRFGQWATAAAESGRALGWILHAAEAFKLLGTIVINIGLIIHNVLRAAGVAGTGVLLSIANVTGAFVRFLNTAQGLSGVQGLFQSLGVVSGAILRALGILLPQIGKGLAQAGPGLKDLSVALVGVLIAVGPLLVPAGKLVGVIATDLAGALTTVTPLVTALGQVLGDLLTPIAGSEFAIWSLIAAWTAWKLLVLATTAVEIPAAIAGFVAVATTEGIAAATSWALATAAAAAWTAIGGPIGLIVIGIAAVLAALVWLELKFHFIETAARAVGDAAVWLWQSALLPAAHAIGDAAVWLWDNAIRPAFEAIVVAVKAVGSAATWLWDNAIGPAFNAIMVVVTAVGAVIGWLWSVVGPPLTAIAQLVLSMYQLSFAIVFAAIELGVRTVAAVVTWLWSAAVQPAVSAIGAAFTWLWGIAIKPALDAFAAAAVGLFNAAIKPAFDGIVVAVKALGTAAQWVWNSALKPAWNAIASAATWLWQTVIVPAFNAIVSAVRSAIDKVVSAGARVKSFVENLSSNFTAAVNAVRSKIDSVVSIVKGLPGRIVSALGSLASLLFDAGKNVVQGLIDGIAAKFNDLKDKVAGLVGLIRDHLPFSPAKIGPLSGSGDPTIAGAAIAGMLADGIEQSTGRVRAASHAMALASRLEQHGATDVFGGGILSQALAAAGGNRPATPTFSALPAHQPVMFSPGAININFHGSTPTLSQAQMVGEAVGRGIATTLARSDVSTQIRTL